MVMVFLGGERVSRVSKFSEFRMPLILVQRSNLSSDGCVALVVGDTRTDAQPIGFPLDFFPVLFAVPRVVGWLAHWRQVCLGPCERSRSLM